MNRKTKNIKKNQYDFFLNPPRNPKKRSKMTNISKYSEILKNPKNLLFSNLTFFDRKKFADKKLFIYLCHFMR